jgi:hypothetical protein
MGNDRGCFLCNPDSEVVYYRDKTSIALCGLGPLVKGYSLVAARNHVHSAADAALDECVGLLEGLSAVRRHLSHRFGSCLVTEHGRVPVCVNVSGTTDPHCYHAHFLLFPAAPIVETAVRAPFAVIQEASDLAEALKVASTHEEYFLFSPTDTRFLVLTRPGKLVRQFSRMIVASALGEEKLANWRRFPNRESAVADAVELRALVYQ